MKKYILLSFVFLDIFSSATSSKNEESFKIKIEVKNTTKVDNVEASTKNKFVIKSKLTQEELENYFKAKNVSILKFDDERTGDELKIKIGNSVKIKEIKNLAPYKIQDTQKDEQQVFLQQKKIEKKENNNIFSSLIYLTMIFVLSMVLYSAYLKILNFINKENKEKIEFSDNFNYTLYN